MRLGFSSVSPGAGRPNVRQPGDMIRGSTDPRPRAFRAPRNGARHLSNASRNPIGGAAPFTPRCLDATAAGRGWTGPSSERSSTAPFDGTAPSGASGPTSSAAGHHVARACMGGAAPVVSIASRTLFHARTRLAVSAGGVGFAIMLVLILAATYDGVYRQAGLFVENSGADLFVGQAGVVDTLHSFSILPLNLSEEIATIPGVERVCAIISRTVEAHIGAAEHPRFVLVGYNESHGTAAPWKMLEGGRLPEPGEIVIDQVLARKDGVSLGAEVTLGGRTFRVSGVSVETNMFIMQYAFVRFEEIQGIVLPPGSVTYFLVKVSEIG